MTITDRISLIKQVYQQSFCCGKECGRGKTIEEDIPDSIDATLEQIEKDTYVNIYTIFQILITIPMSSALVKGPCQPFKDLFQDRHREMELDFEQIMDLFANLHPRRMRMENILNE